MACPENIPTPSDWLTNGLDERAEEELRHERLLTFLNSDVPAWRDEDHPDIVAVGTAAWVHNLRRERSPRQERLEELANGNAKMAAPLPKAFSCCPPTVTSFAHLTA